MKYISPEDRWEYAMRAIYRELLLLGENVLCWTRISVNKKGMKIVVYLCCLMCFFFCGAATQRGSWPPHSWDFLDHTQRRTKVGRTPLDEWSARRRDLYLKTHNTHNRQTSMPPVGFEPTISAGERLQTYALDRAATGTGLSNMLITCIFLTFQNLFTK